MALNYKCLSFQIVGGRGRGRGNRSAYRQGGGYEYGTAYSQPTRADYVYCAFMAVQQMYDDFYCFDFRAYSSLLVIIVEN
jgi:hypothetical protein